MRLPAALFLVACSLSAAAQDLITAGPMIGHTELRSTTLWLEHQSADQISITYKAVSHTSGALYTNSVKPLPRSPFGQQPSIMEHTPWQTVRFMEPEQKKGPCSRLVLRDLEPGRKYIYRLCLRSGKQEQCVDGSFTTQSLWQWRKPAPDFTFLTGSCAYFNQPEYDRPGKPYGGDSSIFLTMAKTPADFMLWLGDNWYTREVDYYSASGLRYRARHDRSQPVLQPLLQAMPHYAIWDDHDYGPNDFGASYVLKEESRQVFMDYWANPSYGINGQGIYTQFAWNDVAFFLLDDRWWRSADNMKDSIGGKPNPDKRMFGKEQLEWLKNALLQSRYSSFKIIATGSQVLNPYSPFDCFYHCPAEYKELMDFIADNRINGVVFLTGDRHHSEVIRQERPGHYPLYDITVSPLTSGPSKVSGPEKDNPARVPRTLVEEQNFGRITIKGEKGKRILQVGFTGLKGNLLGSWEVGEQELREP